MQFKQVDNPRGNPLKINGQIWIFAPLSLGTAEKLMPKLKTFDPSDFALVVDVAHGSLKRNYPDITREWETLTGIWANSNMRCDSLKSLMIINKLSKFL